MTEEARGSPQLSRCKLVHGEPMGAALGRRVVSYGYWADGDPSRGPGAGFRRDGLVMTKMTLLAMGGEAGQDGRLQ